MNYREETTRRVHEVIANFMRLNHGHSPSFREIQELAELSSTSQVSYHLRKLQKAGLVQLVKGRSRLITLLKSPAGMPAIDFALDGVIGAGRTEPEKYDPDPTDKVSVPTAVLDNLDVRNLMVLKVKGDSMVDENINDGDMVLVKKQDNPERGQIMAVWLRRERITTLKRWDGQEGDEWVYLRPANSKKQDEYTFRTKLSNVRVIGKYVSVIPTID